MAATVPASFRQLQLFDYTPIKDPYTDDPLYLNTLLSSILAIDDYILIGQDCYLKIVDKSYTLVFYALAYSPGYRITFIKSYSKNLFLTLAECQGLPSIIKLWDVTQILENNLKNNLKSSLKHNIEFIFNSQIIINSLDYLLPISSFTFSDDLSILAVGFTSGKVILIRGDILRDRGSKQRVIYESNDPVTGLQLSNNRLFVTTTSKILLVPLVRNERETVISTLGVDLHCETFSLNSLIVANASGLQFYNNFQKTNSINYNIKKSRIYKLHKNYLLIISDTRIIILDLLNNHSSFNLLIPNTLIIHFFMQKDDIFLLSNDGTLYKIHEKPINQQIELIIQRDLYNVAYTLAKENNLSSHSLLRIQKLNGNHVHKQGKFDDSIDVYIKCLDFLQGDDFDSVDTDSEEFIMSIITKFKDVQNIVNLTKFLKALHDKSLASNDHITLLLCCYCKLKLVDDLDTFINKFDENLYQDLNFSLIINLFKECGFFNQVTKLLIKLDQPDSIVEIYLYDLSKPRRALNFIKTLTIDDLLLILINHSKSLLDHHPLETTQLLINVFTGKYLPLESVVENETEQSYTSSNPLTSYHAFVNYIANFSNDEEEEVQKISEPTYLPPRPSLIFPSFIDHTNEFVIFLEACIESFDKYQGNINDKKELILTLLEMYLKLSQTEVNSDHWLKNAENLIKENSPNVDNSDLLLISHVYDFPAGEILAKQQSGYEISLFTGYQVLGDVEKSYEIVKKYGDSKPELYKLMMKFVVSSEEYFEKIQHSDFQFLLKKIQQFKLINPLELLNILTGNHKQKQFLTLGLIKDYLIDYIDQQNREIVNNTKLMESYEAESSKNSAKLVELTSKPFIIRKNNCDNCTQRLDYPMIHFRCKHSYHQRCINSNLVANSTIKVKETQCPKCSDEFEEIGNLRYNQFKSKDNLEYFTSGLNDAKDKFKFMTDYIGKGVMENDFVTINDV